MEHLAEPFVLLHVLSFSQFCEYLFCGASCPNTQRYFTSGALHCIIPPYRKQHQAHVQEFSCTHAHSINIQYNTQLSNPCTCALKSFTRPGHLILNDTVINIHRLCIFVYHPEFNLFFGIMWGRKKII